jgi:excinuclease UvrABC nuclease subunit|tara:strand:- start:13148 stop:13585 length:438 start_codon:yes stop_codon:yes gene_type:complete
MNWITHIKVENIKPEPGIYAMYDTDNRLIYIGQSKDVNYRVSKHPKRSKYASIKVRHIKSYDERINLEERLIRRLKPKLNRHLKGSKVSYVTARVRLELREDLIKALRLYATMHSLSLANACYEIMRQELSQELQFVKEYENGED